MSESMKLNDTWTTDDFTNDGYPRNRNLEGMFSQSQFFSIHQPTHASWPNTFPKNEIFYILSLDENFHIPIINEKFHIPMITEIFQISSFN